MINKACGFCGADYVAKGRNATRQIFCSRTCMLASKRITVEKTISNCVVCGQEFLKSRPDHVICSRSCSDKKYFKFSDDLGVVLKAAEYLSHYQNLLEKA